MGPFLHGFSVVYNAYLKVQNILNNTINFQLHDIFYLHFFFGKKLFTEKTHG